MVMTHCDVKVCEYTTYCGIFNFVFFLLLFSGIPKLFASLRFQVGVHLQATVQVANPFSPQRFMSVIYSTEEPVNVLSQKISVSILNTYGHRLYLMCSWPTNIFR